MPVVNPGETILLTGVSGYIGSVAVKVIIDEGYKVRGTVRSASKYAWMPEYYGPDFSLVEVPDFTADHAFDEALDGVAGVIHMAADVTYSHDASLVDTAVDGVNNLLQSASETPSVKRVVLTSARASCMNEMPGVKYKITPDIWNDAVIEDLKNLSEADSAHHRSITLYGAAKTLAERAAFDFVRENKPHFVFNSVLPNVNLGMVVGVEHMGFRSSGALVNALDKGIPLGPMATPSQWFINTKDTALLHLGTLTLEEVQNERLLGMAGPFSWTAISAILREKYPERKKILDVKEGETDLGEADNSRPQELLRKMGRPGFRTLEESLVENMESVIHAETLPKIGRSPTDDFLDLLTKGAGAAA